MVDQRGLGFWENDDEAGTSAGRVIDVSPSAERRSVFGDKGKTEPSSLACSSGASAGEPFEYSHPVRFVDTSSGIVHGDHNVTNSLD